MANQSFNLNEAFKTLVASPIEKFLILCLIILLVWVLKKFFKFLETTVENFRNDVKALEKSNTEMKANNDTQLDSMTKLMDNTMLEMRAFKSDLLKDFATGKNEMLAQRQEIYNEMAKVRADMQRNGAAMPTVQAAMTQYQKKVDVLEHNFSLFIKALEKRKEGKQ